MLKEETQTAKRNIEKKRGGYQRISDDIRKVNIEYWKEHKDHMTMTQMADKLGVPRTTLASIIQVYKKTGETSAGTRGGYIKNPLPNEMVNFITLMVDHNLTVTLEEIQHELKENFNTEQPVPITAIDYALKTRILFTLRRVNKCFEKINDIKNKKARADFYNRLLEEKVEFDNKNWVFIGESEFDIWITLGLPRSRRDAPAFVTGRNERKRHLSLIASISSRGMELCTVNNNVHGLNHEKFVNFMNQLYIHLDKTEAPNQTIFMEESPIQLSPLVKEVLDKFTRHKIIYLPVFSTSLNPTEHLFSDLKPFIGPEYLDETVTMMRKMEEKMSDIEPSTCQKWIENAMSF